MRSQGLTFAEYVLKAIPIGEIDDDRDVWLKGAAWEFWQVPIGDADDALVHVHDGVVSASLEPLHRSWKAQWTPGVSATLTKPNNGAGPTEVDLSSTSDELGDEEYEALIMLHPAGVRAAMTWTGRVTLDLDPDASA